MLLLKTSKDHLQDAFSNLKQLSTIELENLISDSF